MLQYPFCFQALIVHADCHIGTTGYIRKDKNGTFPVTLVFVLFDEEHT